MKKSHDAVNYRRGDGDHRCGNCTMYRSPVNDRPHCTDVLDPISPGGVCDIFVPKQHRESRMRADSDSLGND